ncbi:MAG: ABC transporter permease, partial [Clostridia bacterium]|nr:ABC transporter permease [Clostridia bacterium]
LSLRPTDKKGIYSAYVASKEGKTADIDLYEVSDIVDDIKQDKAHAVIDEADINRIAEDIKADKQENDFSEAEAEVLGIYIDAQSDEAAEAEEETEEATPQEAEDEPHDKNVKLMSPTMMVVRRFFRSKLSLIGLIMLVGLFLFSFVGPLIYTQWDHKTADGETEIIEYAESVFTFEVNGQVYEVKQAVETQRTYNQLAPTSKTHPLGTDKEGYDVLARLMKGGQTSLLVSFLAVFLITFLGVIFGGIAGYFGGWIDNVIMRICDILMCLPGVPILLIVGFILDGAGLTGEERIYLLMAILSLISWPGTARLVRGQILSLREQEYMVAAEAMGYSAGRKIFKHLIPNVMPQLIVQMSLSLGSMILYEATLSYLNLGVKAPNAAWGTIINIISQDADVLKYHPLVWVPAGICIVIAVLGFNFVGDGLRDALDPKARR